jgi:peptidoglycan L-alanyl-D-glutamate endopeptidase CwlK
MRSTGASDQHWADRLQDTRQFSQDWADPHRRIVSNLDPRLEKVTTALLRSAQREHSIRKRAAVEKEVQATVTMLWPDLPLQQDPSLRYKEPTHVPPAMTSAEFVTSLRGKGVPEEMIDNLALVDVEYRGFDGNVHGGQIVVHRDLEESIRRIFHRIVSETEFPLTCVTPVSRFGWSDSASIKSNNASGFNWRLVSESVEVSDHAFGSAVDLNPLINPWVRPGAANREYDADTIGTLSQFSEVVQIFKDEGWKWGGDWRSSKDWQHFYRPDIPLKHFGKEELPE